MTTILKKEVGEILYSVHKACVNGIRMKLPLSCCLTKDARPRVCYVPCNKGIRIPKSDKFCLENPEFSSTNTGFCLMIGILNSSFTVKESIIDYLIPESKSVLDNLTDGTRYSKYVPHSTVIYIQDTDQFVIHGHCLVSVLYVLYRLYYTNARL